ncbi:MAG: Spy/CpxP family protein refolding chaperone [Gemmatimonadaceae bacterium]
MKKVRLAMLTVAMFLGITTVARAQDPQGRGNRPNMSAMLFKDITLTPAQQAKADSISSKYREQMQALRAGGGDQQEMRAKGRELQEKQRDELKAILTDDQKKTFDKNVEDMRQQMQNRRPPGSL